jgi:AAA family ATP:ADP antiporter
MKPSTSSLVFTYPFLLMFLIVSLLNVNYSILKSARTTLAVADVGGGAHSIPWYELFGTMPAAFLMTLVLTKMINRFSIAKVFILTLVFFVGLFTFLCFVIYPNLEWISSHFFTAQKGLIPSFFSFVFFVFAELWKISLLAVLFWGFINQFIPLDEAKSSYAPLMLAGSVGTMLAGPLISVCTADWLAGTSWVFSLQAMMLVVLILSVLIIGLFFQLKNIFHNKITDYSPIKNKNISVFESFSICFQSKYLFLIAWLTIADYIAYALGEVVFLELVYQKYPDQISYCDFMGKLSFWTGALTALSSLLITPLLLKKFRWVVSSLVTPICLLATEGVFFFVSWNKDLSQNLVLSIAVGSIFYCVVRAVKFTLFDTSKEISFLLLPPLEKIQGKLVIDGICSRIGRGSGSLVSLVLIQASGGILASIPIAGSIAVMIASSCVLATTKLGLLVEDKMKARRSILSDQEI